MTFAASLERNADIIRRACGMCEAWGRPIAWVEGWDERGWPSAPYLDPKGIVNHHTATGALAYDYPSLGIVRDGHAGLPYPPLANFGGGRHTGTIYVIAAGKATHAGGGGWSGLAGNGSVWGVEWENNGIGEGWGAEILLSALYLNAALCMATPLNPANICEHYEWSDGGKIDRANCSPDNGDFRRVVFELVEAGGPVPGRTPIAKRMGLWVPIYAN